MIDKQDLLIEACKKGALEVVKVLVEQGADIHVDYPLCYAAEHGHLEVVRYLVERGADVHAWNDWPILIAKYNKHTSVIEYLKTVMVSRTKHS